MAKRKRKSVSIADHLDLFSHFIVSYFDTKYKVKHKLTEVRRAVEKALIQLKQEFVKSIVEALFLTTGLLALVIGIVMMLSKVMPLEYVLIGYGVIVSIGVLLRMKVDL